MNKTRTRSLVLALGVVFLILALVLPTVLPPVVLADLPTQARVPDGVRERLPLGWERADTHTIYRKIGTEQGKGPNGSDLAVYEAAVSTLPQVMPDGTTAIDAHWYLLTDNSGKTWFETGTNLLKGRVVGGRVSVEDGAGKLAVWDSRIVIGGVSVEGGTPSITDDPINENYKGNTLVWDYGTYRVSGGEAALVRYLRVIEGAISELWYLPKAPITSILLDINRQTETGYRGDVEWMSGWDNKGHPVQFTTNVLGMFVISADTLKGLEYPVWLDPTLTFTTSSSDGDIEKHGAVYATVQSAASGTTVYTALSSICVGQYLSDAEYWIFRGFLYFNTASLPDDATISSAKIRIYRSIDESDTDFYITVQSGMPTYPHTPAVLADYNKTYYTGTGGQFHSSGFAYGYNDIILNSAGQSWINKASYTKFCLRNDREIATTVPTGAEGVVFYSYERGTGYQPELVVVYTVPVVVPTVSTQPASGVSSTAATLNAKLTNDGGESCSARFQYDVSTSYGYATTWVAGYTTDESFAAVLTGLTPGILYYYRGQAANAAGTGTGSGVTFLTLPESPYSFVVTEGNTQVDLAWAKGAGSIKTMIRRSTTTYPATVKDGTQVYFDTGSTKLDVGLTNGVTYYYSAWGYASSGGLEEYSSIRTVWVATPQAPALATVGTLAATSVGAATANLNLLLSDLGGYGSADVSFRYGLTAPAYGTNTTPDTLTSVGTYQKGIAGLAPATLYHFQAMAENPTGWAYGVDRTFTTGSTSAPTMTTSAASGVQLTSAQLNGVVTSDGSLPPVTVWFEWGLTTSFGQTSPSVGGLSTGSTFYYGLSGLAHSTLYYFRAVGENTDGIGYSTTVLNFTTSSPSAPTVVTTGSTGVGSHVATLQGQVSTDGGVTVETCFAYGNSTAYGTNTSWVSGFSAGQSFTALISGLELGTTYHFMAMARNAGGTGTGADASFTTTFTGPTGFAATATSYATIQLVWTPQGDQTHIRYKQGSYPVDRLDGTAAYFGAGSTAAVSGLTAGTTYYFKAWSWATGDLWAATTATALATTLAGVVYGGDPEEPPESLIPASGTPDTWSTSPNSTRLVKMPGYGAFEAARNRYQLPEGTFYFGVAMLITGLWFLIGYAVGKRNPLAGILFGAVALGICSWLGMVSLFMVIVYIVLAGGIAFFISRRGSEA